MKKIVFPDLQVLLHFSPLDELDLQQLFGCMEIDVLFTLIVIEELVRCQVEHSVQDVRHQAHRTLKRVEAWVAGQHTIGLNIAVGFLEKRLETDTIKRFGLNWQRPGDLLLGVILEYKEAYPEESVSLLTGDSDLARQARLWGIEAVTLSKKQKLTEAGSILLTGSEKAQQSLVDFRYRTTSLSLSFRSGGDEVTVRLSPQLDSLPATMQAQLVAVADRMQREVDEQTNDPAGAMPDDLEALAALAMRTSPTEGSAFLVRIAQEEVKRYQREIVAYPEKFARYLNHCLEILNEHRRTIQLDLVLVNGGGAQAENVVLTLKLPERLEWLQQPEQDNMPAPPAPPTPPESDGQLLGKEFHVGEVTSVSSHLLNQDLLAGGEVGGTLPEISEAGTRLQWSVGSCRHHELRPLASLYLRFKTGADVADFTITYAIQESNNSQLVREQLRMYVDDGATLSMDRA
ncbi:MAG: hypothetical protein H6658_05865 [Ardenticatenaceae bacterium]|nr:hypothetical protein [Ardenticatenaceae bacterium]